MKVSFEQAKELLSSCVRAVVEYRSDGCYVNWSTSKGVVVATGFIGDHRQYSSPRSNIVIKLRGYEDTHFDGAIADLLDSSTR